MDNLENAKNYLDRLKNLEKDLNDDNMDNEFVSEIDDLLNQLNEFQFSDSNNGDYLMKVKYKKLTNDAVPPSYSKNGDAGLDLVAISIISEDDKSITYGTGIAMEIPRNHVGLVFPRSSIRKYGLVLSNSVGVIDSGYRGEIQVSFKKTSSINFYNVGDRVAQIIIIPYPTIHLIETDELSETERGDGGFGSTGN